MEPIFSFLLPVRGRPAQLDRFLTSAFHLADNPNSLEAVLLTDEDDQTLAAFEPSLPAIRPFVRRLTLPPGMTMGEMNRRCFAESKGRFAMLVNDDIVVRSKGWDTEIIRQFSKFPDGIALIHVNDRLFGSTLCTFPCISRQLIEHLGGPCPPDYVRYRIDDHIFHIFSLLAYLGYKRIQYLPQIVFEHLNYSEGADRRKYAPDPDILGRDAETFERLCEERISAALCLLEKIDGPLTEGRRQRLRAKLKGAPHAFTLRRRRYLNVVGVDPDREPLWERVMGRLLAPIRAGGMKS